MGGRGASSGLFETDRFEKVKSFSAVTDNTIVVRETEKAVAVKTTEYIGTSSTGYRKDRLVWFPKSQVKIKDGKIVEAKGWVVDKNMSVIVSKKSEDRAVYKYSKKDSFEREKVRKKYKLEK